MGDTSAPIRDAAHGVAVLGTEFPVRMVTFERLGIPRESFLRSILPTFASLDWDFYDVRRAQVQLLRRLAPGARAEIDAFYPGFFAGQRHLDELSHVLNELHPRIRQRLFAIRPHRRRAVAQFLLRSTFAGTSPAGSIGCPWTSERKPMKSFTQAADDDRAMARVFSPMVEAVADAPAFRALLHGIGSAVLDLAPRARALSITVHQVSLVATENMPADNSPEGIHQDGSDYIVSAFVVERRGISGGQSRLFVDGGEHCVFRMVLQEGEGLLQVDRHSRLWHDVTPVCLSDPRATDGVRNLFGFDVNVISPDEASSIPA